jgi:hypothetical protein
MTERKIEISKKDEYNFSIIINNVNDIDILLFTSDFFKMLGIDFIEPQLVYSSDLSKTGMVVKDNKIIENDSIDLNIPKNDLPFIKTTSVTISTIWNSINKMISPRKNNSVTQDADVSTPIVLNDKTNMHPNPDYTYKIVLDIDTIENDTVLRLNAYLKYLTTNNDKTIFNMQNNGLTYKNIIEIVEDVYLQLDYLMNINVSLSQINLNDIYFVANRFILLNTDNMEKKERDESSEANMAKVFLEFIVKFTGVDKYVLCKMFENTVLSNTIYNLENGVFLM